MEGNLVYLFAAFFIVWAILFFYIFTLARKQRELMRELAALKEERKAKVGEA